MNTFIDMGLPNVLSICLIADTYKFSCDLSVNIEVIEEMHLLDEHMKVGVEGYALYSYRYVFTDILYQLLYV